MASRNSCLLSTLQRRPESLGDDAVKASEYGMRNLKIIMSHLDEWTQKTARTTNIPTRCMARSSSSSTATWAMS